MLPAPGECLTLFVYTYFFFFFFFNLVERKDAYLLIGSVLSVDYVFFSFSHDIF